MTGRFQSRTADNLRAGGIRRGIQLYRRYQTQDLPDRYRCQTVGVWYGMIRRTLIRSLTVGVRRKVTVPLTCVLSMV